MEMKCDIKDINLAEQGLNNIQWAMKDMPVLEQIKKRFIEEKPFAGLRSVFVETPDSWEAFTRAVI